MRKELSLGLSLAVATLLIVLIGEWLDLELTSTVLLGVTAGAVVGLVPDRSVIARVGGFAAGFVISWIGYFLRAGLMPDTETGRAITFGVVVLVALGVTLATMMRLPFWSVLLGVGVFAGAFEAVYEARPAAGARQLDHHRQHAPAHRCDRLPGRLLVRSGAAVDPRRVRRARRARRASRRRVLPHTESTRTRKDDDNVAFDSMMGNNR